MTSHLYDIYKNKKYFGGLDGLRFLSIFAVVWHHTPFRLGWFNAENYGFLGVDLFFVISGFLIVTLLLRERDKVGTISLRAFYIRRSLRIFPLYYGFLCAIAILYLIFNPESERALAYFADLPIYLLYLSNMFPIGLGLLWSLASEEQFYLVWPFFEKYFRKYIYHILIFSVLINQLMNFQRAAIAEWLGMPHLNDLSIMQVTFTPILLGVGLAHALHNKSTFIYAQKLLSASYATLLWLVLLVVSCSFLPDDISGLTRLFIQIVMMLLVGSVVIREDTKLMPLLKFRPIARIGAISYGIYLFHIHAIVVAKNILVKVGLDQELMVFILGYGLSIVAAELSYRFFETPFLKLKAKFSVIHQKHM